MGSADKLEDDKEHHAESIPVLIEGVRGRGRARGVGRGPGRLKDKSCGLNGARANHPMLK